jgi:hypothetical protein
MAMAGVAASYARLFVLHGDDKLRPSSPDWFLARSSLRWATGRGLDGVPAPEAAFYRHSTNKFRNWDSVAKDAETHPIAYSAIGSHASLPTPGFGHVDVGDPDGPRWRTWEALISIVEGPWYGFGGAWGRVGKVRDATGPLGPGPHWKHAAPRPPD